MIKVGGPRLWTGIALSLIISAVIAGSTSAAVFGLFGSDKKEKAVARQSLMVFPFDQNRSVKVPDGFGVELASALRDQLSETAYFAAYAFSDRLAPIKRAIDDGSIKRAAVNAPYSDDKSKSLMLAQLLGTEVFVVGSVEEFVDDANGKKATMTLSAELFDGKRGRLVKTFLVTGHGESADEDDRMAIAAGDAVAKLKDEFVDVMALVKSAESPKKGASAKPNTHSRRSVGRAAAFRRSAGFASRADQDARIYSASAGPQRCVHTQRQ